MKEGRTAHQLSLIVTRFPLRYARADYNDRGVQTLDSAV